MGIAEGHCGGRMPQEVADRGEWYPAHHQPGGEGMAEVVKVGIGQASALTGPVKGVPDIVPAMPDCIMEHPWHVLPGP